MESTQVIAVRPEKEGRGVAPFWLAEMAEDEEPELGIYVMKCRLIW